MNIWNAIVSIVVGLGAGCIGAWSNFAVELARKRIRSRETREEIRRKIGHLQADEIALLKRFLAEGNPIKIPPKPEEAPPTVIFKYGWMQRAEVNLDLPKKTNFYILDDLVCDVCREMFGNKAKKKKAPAANRKSRKRAD